MIRKNAIWSDVKSVAELIFNVRAYDVDLEWAERAWGILEKTPLCQYCDDQEYYIVLVRLFCLGEIIHIYNDLAIDESYDPYETYPEWFMGYEIQKIRFILLAGEDYFNDVYIEENGKISVVIDHLIEQQYDMVVKWLILGFGDKNNLIASLEDPTGENKEDTFTYEEAIDMGMNPEELIVTEKSVDLYQWKENNFTRHFA